MTELRLDDQVGIVTGAGSGLGKAHALHLASRGAKVLVNDASRQAADNVVREIVAAGGKAAANYDSVLNGGAIIQDAIQKFQRLDILVNSASILRDASFEAMTDADWDDIDAVHVKGLYKCTHAAWQIFRKQKYGRIIMTSSTAGLFGSPGQCNLSAATLGVFGLAQTLAKEGAKYNILVNAIAPIATSQLPATATSPEILRELGPEHVSPLVTLLVHSTNKESGSVFEVGAGYVSKFRWERSSGAVLKCDANLTPGAVLARWAEVNDFSRPDHPTGPADMMAHLNAGKQQERSDPGEDIRYDGKVAVITGGGAGLGRAYSITFARRGAAVVVNDLVNPDAVVEEIRAFGGRAVGNRSSVEDGTSVIKTAIDCFGRIDILVNNAGILRDKAFINMTERQWDDIINVHLRGTYACTKAAYPYMLKQKYGRIINTTSTSGVYGNYGQTNYAMAKMGILGFSMALALEAAQHNIYVNTIAPSAGTQLTRTVMPEELIIAYKPEFVAPLVLALCSDRVPKRPTGGLYEVGCGWQGRTRWQRSGVHTFELEGFTPEAIRSRWENIINFDDGRADTPESPEEGLKPIMNIVKRLGRQQQARSPHLSAIEDAKNSKVPAKEFIYTDRDAILYNISLGATSNQLALVYEGHPEFRILPTFGVIMSHAAVETFDLGKLLPNFQYKMLLHGEQYLEIRKWPIPTSAQVRSYPALIDVTDKGKAAVVVSGTTTVDAQTGEELFYNETTLFIRGSGGFGGPQRSTVNRGNATAEYGTPDRAPDFVAVEKTSQHQAALYRLNGDRNPLHIDPAVSHAAGFQHGPILHGLCSFGLTGKHIQARYGNFRSMKTRFSGTVLPGQTLQVEMWKQGRIIFFQTRVKESGKLCLSSGGVELLASAPKL